MTIHRLLSSHTRSIRSLSTATATATAAAAAISTPISNEISAPPLQYYDRLAAAVHSKLARLENPNPLFLRHASPHPTLADHSSILLAPETHVTTLPNGLRVATESNMAAETATIGVWIDAGSRYETEETNGTAHFLEHMIFKGTEKRDVKKLGEEVENMGGHLNAYTSREHTMYYAKVMKSDSGKAVDLLADILQFSKFNDRSIDVERDVILREMEKVEAQTRDVLFDHLHATAFQYTPLGRTIVGTARNIKTITNEHLKKYIETHYTAPRMVISAGGGVKHDDLVEQVSKLFPNLSADPTSASQLVAKQPAIFTGSEVRIQDDDIPLVQFAVAFNGASWTDPDSIALMVMQSMLGSWDKNTSGGKHSGSDLVQKTAINEIADSVMAFNTNYKDTGLFGVYAAAEPDCVDDVAYVIMGEISKLCYRVSDEDVTRARNQLKSSLQLRMDGTSKIAEDIGRQLLTYGRRIPAAELFARIDAVDASMVKRVANRFIFDQDIAIVSMGPIKKFPDYNWFRRRTYLNRY